MTETPGIHRACSACISPYQCVITGCANEKHLPNQTTAEPDRIRLAHEIAVKLWDAGVRGPDGVTIMALALGIYMEAQEGAHRGLQPLATAMCSVAQQTFDAFQHGRGRSGHA